jgi:hypothetical protein
VATVKHRHVFGKGLGMTIGAKGVVALFIAVLATMVLPCVVHPGQASSFAWHAHANPADALAQRLPPPEGFVRQPMPAGSFAAWLRALPLKPPGTPVRLFNGTAKAFQTGHVAVVDIDVGNRDLQQCADAIMRLRAEWLWSEGQHERIGFNYTGGGRVAFARWAKGERPDEHGRRWSKRAAADASYAGFRSYLNAVFAQAGTYSLAQELKPVPDGQVQIGDVFIRGGFPGHAVLVGDMVVNPTTGEQRMLLIQSFMPAQDIHILKVPGNGPETAWYPLPGNSALLTHEYIFLPGSLRRWPQG